MVTIGSESRTGHKNMLCEQISELFKLKQLLQLVATLV
jgi:hypothetical protein